MANNLYPNPELPASYGSFVQQNFVVSFSHKNVFFSFTICFKVGSRFSRAAPGSLSSGFRSAAAASEEWDVKVCVRGGGGGEEEEMWRPYAAVVCLLWLLLLISGAAMCCQVAWALLSALGIHSEKHNVETSSVCSAHIRTSAGHDGNRDDGTGF